ncbi:hypothetical protein OPT61_g10365 [Boeremia exigua]|uniref:Uncharacterized protein n=1 Tax=Boeremia exigua TaxID=749465 RepID=A0ACC2HQ73_9PLEO|nr:hypothetical protein OPT61_g10365 [Boeremia exigua]
MSASEGSRPTDGEPAGTMSYCEGKVRLALSAQITVPPLPDCCCAGATMRTGYCQFAAIEELRCNGFTFVSSVLEQLVQFPQISAAEAVVIAHEDFESIAGGREAQGGSEQCKGDTHSGSQGRLESDRREFASSCLFRMLLIFQTTIVLLYILRRSALLQALPSQQAP